LLLLSKRDAHFNDSHLFVNPEFSFSFEISGT